MTAETTSPPAPEFVVLERLKETLELVRRHNPDPAVAKAALVWETKFVKEMDKLSGKEAA